MFPVNVYKKSCLSIFIYSNGLQLIQTSTLFSNMEKNVFLPLKTKSYNIFACIEEWEDEEVMESTFFRKLKYCSYVNTTYVIYVKKLDF